MISIPIVMCSFVFHWLYTLRVVLYPCLPLLVAQSAALPAKLWGLRTLAIHLLLPFWRLGYSMGHPGAESIPLSTKVPSALNAGPTIMGISEQKWTQPWHGIPWVRCCGVGFLLACLAIFYLLIVYLSLFIFLFICLLNLFTYFMFFYLCCFFCIDNMFYNWFFGLFAFVWFVSYFYFVCVCVFDFPSFIRIRLGRRAQVHEQIQSARLGRCWRAPEAFAAWKHRCPRPWPCPGHWSFGYGATNHG